MSGSVRERLGPLTEPDYRLLFIAQATSFIGDGMVPVAISFAVLRLTGSVADVGLALTARYAPLACLLIVGGVMADRLPRRAVMVSADITRFVSQGLLAGLLLSGNARLWQLLVLQAVHGTASAFFDPAVIGLVPQTVSPGHLQQANALRWMANSFGNVIGPAIAGVLVATIQGGAALAVDAGTFAISAGCLAAMRIAAQKPSAAERFLHELVAGWREFRSRGWLISANIIAALSNALVLAPFVVIGPAVAKAHLGGPGAWGLIGACYGAGAIAGGIVAVRVRPRRPLLVGLTLSGLAALPLILLAVHAPAILTAIAAATTGAQITLLNTLWETTLQRLVPSDRLSRVAAYDWMFSLSFTPIGYALAGLLAGSVLGITPTLILAAAVALVLAASAPLIPNIRQLELPPVTQPTARPSSADSLGGASRDRTGDLLLAKQALSQLSYGPDGPSLVVEVEVARGALLEPEPVVIRRVLEEVGRLLEHVLTLSRLRRPVLELLPSTSCSIVSCSRSKSSGAAGRWRSPPKTGSAAPLGRRGLAGSALERAARRRLVGLEARGLGRHALALVRLPFLGDLVMPGRVIGAGRARQLRNRSSGAGAISVAGSSH